MSVTSPDRSSAAPSTGVPPAPLVTTNPACRNGGPRSITEPPASGAPPASPPRRCVLLVQDDPLDRTYADALAGGGCDVSGPAGDDASDVLRGSDPAVVVVVAPAGQGGRAVARVRELRDVRPRPTVVVATDPADAAHAADAADAGAFAFLIAPVAPAALAAAIAIAARRFEELQAAVHDKQMLQQAIETRKLVERAKAVFMKRMKIDEPEAHRRLQRESQNRRIGLAELAKRILENEEMVTA